MSCWLSQIIIQRLAEEGRCEEDGNHTFAEEVSNYLTTFSLIICLTGRSWRCDYRLSVVQGDLATCR